MKKGIIWSQKKMQAQRVGHSGVMGKIMSNKKVSKALDQSRERKEFYGMLKGVAEGGVSKKDLQELSSKLAHGHEARTISQKEGRLIAEGLHEEFYSGLRKYKYSKEYSKTQAPANINPPLKSGLKNNNAPIEKKQIAPIRIATAKRQPVKEPENKQDTVIKLVAPEVYAKVLNTKSAEKKEAIPNKSTGLISDIAENPSTPKEKKQKTAKPLSPEDRERLVFPKSTLSGSTDSVPGKKDLPAGIKTTASAIDNISANKAIQTEALMNSVRKKMLAARGGGESEKPRRGFSDAMAATLRKKEK
jgi:hypothetical protein